MKNNTGSRQEKIEMTAQKIYEHKKGLKEAKMFLQSKTFHKDRFSLLKGMESKGGNFAKKLAEALWIADKSNYNIAIKSFWHTFKPYIKKELYEFVEVYCKCGDAGEYTALDTTTSVFKREDRWLSERNLIDGDEWCAERDIIGGEFRCDHCGGLMPEEIEEKKHCDKQDHYYYIEYQFFNLFHFFRFIHKLFLLFLQALARRNDRI